MKLWKSLWCKIFKLGEKFSPADTCLFHWAFLAYSNECQVQEERLKKRKCTCDKRNEVKIAVFEPGREILFHGAVSPYFVQLWFRSHFSIFSTIARHWTSCRGLWWSWKQKMDYNPHQSAMLREVSFVTQYFYLLIFVWPLRVPYMILVPEVVTEPTPGPLRSGITES